MKNLLLLCLLALLLTSCSESKSIKIISTGERAYIRDWDNLYKTNDTVIVKQDINQSN